MAKEEQGRTRAPFGIKVMDGWSKVETRETGPDTGVDNLYKVEGPGPPWGLRATLPRDNSRKKREKKGKKR